MTLTDLAALSGETVISRLHHYWVEMVQKTGGEPMPQKRSSPPIPIPFDQLGTPAACALQSAEYKTLGQLTRRSERDIASLHGVGPYAMNVLRKHLRLNKLAFAKQ